MSIGSPRDDGAGSPRGGAFRTQGEQRKAQLDAKRQNLVESRMKPQPPGQPDISEPRPPSMPKPDASASMAHGVSPRQLQLEGQAPP